MRERIANKISNFARQQKDKIEGRNNQANNEELRDLELP